MKHCTLIITFSIVFVLLFADNIMGRSRRHKRWRKIKENNSTDFDFLIFTQRWPDTTCFMWKKSSDKHKCYLPSDSGEWTIHGIWPTQNFTEGPFYCNKNIPFQAETLAPIEKELENKWIDIEMGTSSLWKHEWEKHGTCAIVLDQLNSELKYFQKGLELSKQYDMKNILAQANILPEQSYTIQTYLDGVAKVLNKQSQILCVDNSKTKISYLFEIRLCFDKSFNLIDCNRASDFPTNCSHKKNITYPSSVPTKFHVIQI